MNARTWIVLVIVLSITGGFGVWLWMSRSALPKAAESEPERIVRHEADPVDTTDHVIRTALDNDLPYEERITALNELSNHLSSSQQAQLRQLINTRGAHSSLRNDAAGILSRQHDPQPGLILDLAAAWNDPKEDELWQDFALQHLASAYLSASDAEKKVAVATLVHAASDPESASAGTALLSLQRIGEHVPEVAAQAVALAAAELSSGRIHPERLPAVLEIAISSNDPSVLPLARRTVQDETVDILVRMSCIAAIGALGDSSDQALLDSLNQHSDDRIRRAAGDQAGALRKRTAAGRDAQVQ